MLNLGVENSELIKNLFAFETTYSKFASEGDPDLARHARGGLLQAWSRQQCLVSTGNRQ
jgi:hypothetical protein